MKSYNEQLQDAINENSTLLLISKVDFSNENVELNYEDLSKFETVVFSHCNLTSVPAVFKSLPFNIGIGLPNNNIERIESKDFPSKGPESMNLTNNPLSYFDIEGGEGMIDLTLKKHKLTLVPSAICNLPDLRELNLSYGELEEVNFERNGLLKLGSLDLRFNFINRISPSISRLKNLHTLRISSNELIDLPDEISELNLVSAIYVEGNQLESLPESIGGMGSLDYAEFTGNVIKEIPDSIGEIKRLRILKLNYNSLSDLPKSLSGCKGLEHLHISNNNFSEIPEVLGAVPNLVTLDLKNNSINTVPSWIFKKKRLDIDLSHNPIDSQAIEKAVQGIKKCPKVNVRLAGCPVEAQKDQLPKIPGLTFSFEPMN